MRRTQLELVVAAGLLLGGLGFVAAVVPLSGWGWAIASAYAAMVLVTVSKAYAPPAGLGPANRVTLSRAMVVGVVTALAVSGEHGRLTVGLTLLALALDWVDGQVARRVGEPSEFGARFDMEVDAWLVLVLSWAAASQLGWWVLWIGSARYLLWLISRIWPWLADPVPTRYWAKVVAAWQGIALTAALVLPSWLGWWLVFSALVLLIESFAQQVWTLLRRRQPRLVEFALVRGVLVAGVVLAGLWALPHEVDRLEAVAFIEVPWELGVLLAVFAALPWLWSRLVVGLVGTALGALAVLKLLDLSMDQAFNRPIDLLTDWSYLGPGYEVAQGTLGSWGAPLGALFFVLLLSSAFVIPLWALARAAQACARFPKPALGTAAVLLLGGLLLPPAETRLDPALDRWPHTATGDVAAVVGRIQAGLADRTAFAEQVATDPVGSRGPITFDRLNGKDVLLVWVESYGEVALSDPKIAGEIRPLLKRGTEQLATAGLQARSGWLTSPTFGGASWLAHATLQTGLWVDSQQRYNQLMLAKRNSLSSLFDNAGWRSVFVVPANNKDWLEGPSFYGMDKLYDSRNLGYQGRRFGYTPFPDQYTLSAFQRLELARSPRLPVMAEIDLLSSHHPWTSRPTPVPWQQVGDGSVFSDVEPVGGTKAEVFGDSSAIVDAYRSALSYSLSTLVGFLAQPSLDDVVVIMVGDHQPHGYVTGDHPPYQVPITVLSDDRKWLAELDEWGWSPGLVPAEGAPIWRMDEFRDRFIAVTNDNPAKLDARSSSRGGLP